MSDEPILWDEAHRAFKALRQSGLDVVIVRFGVGPGYSDECYAVGPRKGMLGASQDVNRFLRDS